MSSEKVWEGIKVTETQTEASREIDSIFPDVLRSRILHAVQFRTTSRMDDLGKNICLCSLAFANSFPLVNLVFDVRLPTTQLPSKCQRWRSADIY